MLTGLEEGANNLWEFPGGGCSAWCDAAVCMLGKGAVGVRVVSHEGANGLKEGPDWSRALPKLLLPFIK